MIINCGYCDEPLNDYAIDFHHCEAMEFFEMDLEASRISPNNMTYSAVAIAKAEAFLKEFPEFREADANTKSYRRVALGLSPEEIDYRTPSDYEADTYVYSEHDFGVNELTREDEWDSIYELREVTPDLTNWRDVEPKRCTTAFHWWQGKATYAKAFLGDVEVPLTPHNKKQSIVNIERSTPLIYAEAPNRVPFGFTSKESYVQAYEALDFDNPRLMRIEFNDLKTFTRDLLNEASSVRGMEFNELKGFGSELLIDADITEKFQYNVFNAFIGRDQKFHIGLLTFNRDGSTVNVTCGHKGCYYGKVPYSVDVDTSDRLAMEDFVLNCIRHGNNHGPQWITSRKDFTRIHAANCDVDHDDTPDVCNANQPRIFINELNAADFDKVFDFLIHHRKFCTSSECRCTHYYHLLNERNYLEVAA